DGTNHYNKLVRDLIPEIIDREGNACGVDTLDDEAFRAALLDKIVEEAREAAAAESREELIAELADLREVMDALLDAYAIGEQEVADLQQQRRLHRGGFRRRLRL